MLNKSLGTPLDKAVATRRHILSHYLEPQEYGGAGICLQGVRRA